MSPVPTAIPVSTDERSVSDLAMLAHRVSELEGRVGAISERNERVERAKAWETSWTRLVAVTLVTYITMTSVFSVLGSMRPYLDAFVPTTGFFLSTLSLPVIKKIWDKVRR